MRQPCKGPMGVNSCSKPVAMSMPLIRIASSSSFSSRARLATCSDSSSDSCAIFSGGLLATTYSCEAATTSIAARATSRLLLKFSSKSRLRLACACSPRIRIASVTVSNIDTSPSLAACCASK